MNQSEKPSTTGSSFWSIWVPILGFLGVALTAYLTYRSNLLATTIPISATQTAEARLLTETAQIISSSTATLQPTFTLTPTFIPTSTITPTQFICPYQGQTDNDTIVHLIAAEADASNSQDLSIIFTIFDPDAIFHDYAQKPPRQWNGPKQRYEEDLFRNMEFQGVQHFDISPVGPGIDGNTAYYTSGSKGSYRVNGGAWTNFYNGSLISTPSTRYGSEHWVLKKNDKGCWVIVQMDFNAGHIKFP